MFANAGCRPARDSWYLWLLCGATGVVRNLFRNRKREDNEMVAGKPRLAMEAHIRLGP